MQTITRHTEANIEPRPDTSATQGTSEESLSPAKYTPLKVAAAWLGGTYVLFLTLGEVQKVPNLPKLTIFISATIAALCTGYVLKIRRSTRHSHDQSPTRPTIHDIKAARLWVTLSGIYLAVFGLAQMATYKASGPSAVLRSILHPGGAYFARIEMATSMQASSARASDLVVQLLTVTAALSVPAIPLTLVCWRKLGIAPRIAAITGITLYASYWLYIGTLKGLGDVLFYALAALMVLGARGKAATLPAAGRSRRLWFLTAATLLVSFLAYMAYNQSDRVSNAGSNASVRPNPAVAAVTGDDFARGLAITANYPTHGYLGLAYNMSMPFVWTHGLGSSLALDSYWVQYFGGKSVASETYPARTELRTGWSARRTWSTIYPWLASDIGFPGAVLFMGLIGWWLARLWHEATRLHDNMALLLLSQLVLLLGYIPANNQIGITRPGLISFVSLAAIYALTRSKKGRGLRTSTSPGTAERVTIPCGVNDTNGRPRV